MAKALRLSEKWFRFGLWLVALVFAGFLIGLGSVVVNDLPQVESQRTVDDYMDGQAAAPVHAALERASAELEDIEKEQEQVQLQYQRAKADRATAQDNFAAWRATRTATQRPEQDGELIRRTQALEELRGQERAQLEQMQQLEEKEIRARQAVAAAQAQLEPLQEAAQQAYAAEMRRVELRVFIYRLVLTLPLLIAAGWLFARKRRSTWWPFVWGFILFALFAFFVELVPYLPSYGGYVRYTVGIVITVLVGRYAILALQDYLERQRQIEAMPEVERRHVLSYDLALDRLGKGVCPGCERGVDVHNDAINFCQHCGLELYNHCGNCQSRKSAFARYCYACGAGTQHPAVDAGA